jgi:hypothetical protein
LDIPAKGLVLGYFESDPGAFGTSVTLSTLNALGGVCLQCKTQRLHHSLVLLQTIKGFDRQVRFGSDAKDLGLPNVTNQIYQSIILDRKEDL